MIVEVYIRKLRYANVSPSIFTVGVSVAWNIFIIFAEAAYNIDFLFGVGAVVLSLILLFFAARLFAGSISLRRSFGKHIAVWILFGGSAAIIVLWLSLNSDNGRKIVVALYALCLLSALLFCACAGVLLVAAQCVYALACGWKKEVRWKTLIVSFIGGLGIWLYVVSCLADNLFWFGVVAFFLFWPVVSLIVFAFLIFKYFSSRQPAWVMIATLVVIFTFAVWGLQTSSRFSLLDMASSVWDARELDLQVVSALLGPPMGISLLATWLAVALTRKEDLVYFLSDFAMITIVSFVLFSNELGYLKLGIILLGECLFQ
jgi:hypothetical protein